jgi:hypothetical protein
VRTLPSMLSFGPGEKSVIHKSLTKGLVAEALGNVSDDAVWRVMRKHDLHLDRRQSWCVSTDPEFSRKASEIVGLYLNPPENAIVLSVDEKPQHSISGAGLKVVPLHVIRGSFLTLITTEVLAWNRGFHRF